MIKGGKGLTGRGRRRGLTGKEMRFTDTGFNRDKRWVVGDGGGGLR